MLTQGSESRIVEVAEVIGADNANPYLAKGWILLDVISVNDGCSGEFHYCLGRPFEVFKD